jgi:uncharacterized protein with PIN domain
MRFLVDECTGSAVAQWLRMQKHEVFSVYEEARGIDDDTVIAKAFDENWILITNRLTTLRYPLRVLCEKNFAHFVVKQERKPCRAQRTHKVRKGELYLTSPCRCATSLSFRKERDVLATPKQGEVKHKGQVVNLPLQPLTSNLQPSTYYFTIIIFFVSTNVPACNR